MHFRCWSSQNTDTGWVLQILAIIVIAVFVFVFVRPFTAYSLAKRKKKLSNNEVLFPRKEAKQFKKKEDAYISPTFRNHCEFTVKINRMINLQSSHYFGGYAAPTGGAVGLETVAPGCPGG